MFHESHFLETRIWRFLIQDTLQAARLRDFLKNICNTVCVSNRILGPSVSMACIRPSVSSEPLDQVTQVCFPYREGPVTHLGAPLLSNSPGVQLYPWVSGEDSTPRRTGSSYSKTGKHPQWHGTCKKSLEIKRPGLNPSSVTWLWQQDWWAYLTRTDSPCYEHRRGHRELCKVLGEWPLWLKGGLRNGSPPHPQQSWAPLPDKMRFNERLLWMLWTLNLQSVLQQLGYDIPSRPLFFWANWGLHFLEQYQVFAFYLAELGFQARILQRMW